MDGELARRVEDVESMLDICCRHDGSTDRLIMLSGFAEGGVWLAKSVEVAVYCYLHVAFPPRDAPRFLDCDFFDFTEDLRHM